MSNPFTMLLAAAILNDDPEVSAKVAKFVHEFCTAREYEQAIAAAMRRRPGQPIAFGAPSNQCSMSPKLIALTALAMQLDPITNEVADWIDQALAPAEYEEALLMPMKDQPIQNKDIARHIFEAEKENDPRSKGLTKIVTAHLTERIEDAAAKGSSQD